MGGSLFVVLLGGLLLLFLLGFALLVLGNALLLVLGLALDLAVLLLVLSLLLGHSLLVDLVLGFQSGLGGLVDLLPHPTDDGGQLGDLGLGVLGPHAVVDLPSEEEEGREGALGGGGLSQSQYTLPLSSCLPILSYQTNINLQRHLDSIDPSIITLMIDYFRAIEALLYCLIFLAAVLLSEALIEYQKGRSLPHQARVKSAVMLLTTAGLVAAVYFTHCGCEGVGALQCFFISPGEELMHNIGIALFINTSLFLGGLHQWLYNGSIKRKFLRIFKNQFQWDLFKKLFVVPLCVEIVYRALVCRIVDPHFEHTSFFTFFSAILFSVSHFVNCFKLEQKYGRAFALQTAAIQSVYNLIFGLYISHIFARQQALISSLVLQVYANFLGYPEYFEVLQGNLEDERVRKSALFYLIGAIACLSCCLLI